MKENSLVSPFAFDQRTAVLQNRRNGARMRNRMLFVAVEDEIARPGRLYDLVAVVFDNMVDVPALNPAMGASENPTRAIRDRIRFTQANGVIGQWGVRLGQAPVACDCLCFQN